ncbi:AAA family ATPase [Flavobacterium sp. NRK F7]|uniref:AAA family ATPase n=1 Tax=Flavobacterium sp. NRK F7 TaxID=2954930 RepID=UPI0020911A05|nr:AAA family ATPase [Flavobacterium sp. NRK F7]MCO6161875.1 AAA family ATPase [Flavobacterium sp. NRK F7]
MTFTKEYLQELNKATVTILAICDAINADAKAISELNTLLLQKGEHKLLLKAEKIFISDFIFVFSKVKNLSEKAQFGLAYYYDAIRNQHFANENELENLNKLVATNAFKSHFNKIVQDNILFDLAKSKTYLLNYLKQNKHPKFEEVKQAFNTFLNLVCEFDVQKNKNTNDLLGIDFTIHNATEIENDSLEKVLEELHELIGLENVKKDVSELVNLLKVQQKRTSQGLKNIEITLHTVFLGPPGTGKTTVARLLGRIFKQLDFLSQGQMIETDREGMVAGYVGQTATKVDAIVTEAKGGVLFIDEAYALSQNVGNDYGAEAVNTLLKRMEDFRDDFAVVVAGYDEPMQVFIDSNPGLRSRFNRYFHFDHFSPDELFAIFEIYCKKSDFILTEEAKEKLKDTFELLFEKRDDSFGNARVIRNVFEKVIQKQANRIVMLKRISKKALRIITEEDIPEPMETVAQVFYKKQEE